MEPAASESFEEAKAALVMLGFTQQATQKTLKKLFASEPNLTAEQAIKKALKMMWLHRGVEFGQVGKMNGAAVWFVVILTA